MASGSQIDRDAGLVRGVKILGESSRNPPPNNNVYPRPTREKAAGLIEGAAVYVDHPARGTEGRTRSYRDKFAVLANVREAGDGLYGDLRFNPKHPLAEQFLWDAQHNPAGVGLSINAVGRTSRRGGKSLVEEIVEVNSVDLVSVPATTKGLFESREPMATTTVKAILEANCKAPWQRRILEQMEAEGLPMAAEVPAPAEEESSDDQIWSAFRQAILAAIDDDSLDIKATLKKIGEILKAYEKLTGGNGGEPPADGEGGGEPAPATESLTVAALQNQLAQLREAMDLRLRARDKAIAAGLQPGKVLLKALDSCRSEAEIDELIQEAVQQQRPGQPGQPVQRPRSSPPNGSPKPTSILESWDDSQDARAKRLARLRGQA